MQGAGIRPVPTGRSTQRRFHPRKGGPRRGGPRRARSDRRDAPPGSRPRRRRRRPARPVRGSRPRREKGRPGNLWAATTQESELEGVTRDSRLLNCWFEGKGREDSTGVSRLLAFDFVWNLRLYPYRPPSYIIYHQ